MVTHASLAPVLAATCTNVRQGTCPEKLPQSAHAPACVQLPLHGRPMAARAANGLRRLHHESASQASEFKQDRQKETVHRAAFLFVVVVYALDRREIHPRSQLRPWSRQHKRSRKYGSGKQVLRGPSVMFENFVRIKSAVLASIFQAPWKTWAVHFINVHHLLLSQNRVGVRLNFAVYITCSHP